MSVSVNVYVSVLVSVRGPVPVIDVTVSPDAAAGVRACVVSVVGVTVVLIASVLGKNSMGKPTLDRSRLRSSGCLIKVRGWSGPVRENPTHDIREAFTFGFC